MFCLKDEHVRKILKFFFISLDIVTHIYTHFKFSYKLTLSSYNFVMEQHFAERSQPLDREFKTLQSTESRFFIYPLTSKKISIN